MNVPNYKNKKKSTNFIRFGMMPAKVWVEVKEFTRGGSLNNGFAIFRSVCKSIYFKNGPKKNIQICELIL